MGRLITRDIWKGHFGVPLSLNRWIYVKANPINYSDPSGLIPCSDNQTEPNRYCILERGGYIDVIHYKGKKDTAKRMIDQTLPSLFGKTYGQIPYAASLGADLPPTYISVYYTRLPKNGLPRDLLQRITLGLLMDREYGFEVAQGIDPRCYSIFGFLSHCSAFSNEDLPSDYLGIVSAIKDLSLEEMLSENLLGPGEQSDHVPAGYWGFPWPLSEPVQCILGLCSNDTPFNNQCTFKVFDPDRMGYYNRPWPVELVVEPYGYRVFWAKNILDFYFPEPQGLPFP